MEAASEAAILPNKPIVSDMTVSSKEESDSKADESRDDMPHDAASNGSGEREDMSKGNNIVRNANKGGNPLPGNTNNRFLYPTVPGNNSMVSQQQQQHQQRPPFQMASRNGPPYGGPPPGPPPYFHGSSYPSGPHHGPPHPSFHNHPGSHGPHNHHHPHMMQYNGPSYQQAMPNGPRITYPPSYSAHPPYSMPAYHSMPPAYPMNTASADSTSISSNRSKGSRNSTNKKRTIEGVSNGEERGLPSAYNFRRTDSNSSSTSTVTAGNNTTTETDPIRHDDTFSYGDDHHKHDARRYHRRDYSHASTASSLSAGGFSLGSYEGPRVGAIEDSMVSESSTADASAKRRKANRRELLVDTHMRPGSSSSQSTEADQSTRFEQLSIDHAKMPLSTSSTSSSSHDRNLFLTLSTSPLNNDVDSTPVSKNTKKQVSKNDVRRPSIFKPKGSSQHLSVPKADSMTSDASRPTDTPTPPMHREIGSSMNEDNTVLNRHLRHQSFTPLPHLATSGSTSASPTAGALAASINPQLSWSIAGDTPSLGDLADWEEDNKLSKTDQKPRPNSTSSTESRNMMISPQDFQFWKEDNEAGGASTPLPAFFDQAHYDSTENKVRYGHSTHKPGDEHTHHLFMSAGPRGQSSLKPSNNKTMPPPVWPRNDPSSDKMLMSMPPTPMFAANDFRDDIFGPRSPMGGDRRDVMEFYAFQNAGGQQGLNDRVRNLRGRMPHAHMPPMALHIPPPMSAHLPMTSPMGLGPKPGLWSPHHHPGMPPLASPHHMGSPLGNMAQSKRKCVPLKPPIPSKFQGDVEKARNAQVPEFTSLVNFPGHMSQKQSVNLPEGMRCCVMCGQACACTSGTKTKKAKKPNETPQRGAGGDMGDKTGGFAIIPTQNKGLCTLCDVNVWVVVPTGLEIKWCKGCKNFRPWACFGDKGLATKCLRCRDRQREKYALQKEEKEKTRVVTKAK